MLKLLFPHLPALRSMEQKEGAEAGVSHERTSSSSWTNQLSFDNPSSPSPQVLSLRKHLIWESSFNRGTSKQPFFFFPHLLVRSPACCQAGSLPVSDVCLGEVEDPLLPSLSPCSVCSQSLAQWRVVSAGCPSRLPGDSAQHQLVSQLLHGKAGLFPSSGTHRK